MSTGKGPKEQFSYQKRVEAVSDVRPKVALVTCSDLHLSLEAPRARAEKGDEWLRVQERYLRQLKRIATDHNAEIAYAGDIFNSPYEPPELVNWAMQYLPPGYAVPGNHELPYHRYEDVHKSVYWTLVKAEQIENIPPGHFRTIGGGLACIHGFPWGTKVEPRDMSITVDRNTIHVALIHDYIWTSAFGYKDAPDEKRVINWLDKLKGYDVAVFGDNHKAFMNGSPGAVPWIINNGMMIPRTIDESGHVPHVGLIYEDGTVGRVPLDCRGDKWVDQDVKVESPAFTSEEMEELMRTLRTSKRQRADFIRILLRSVSSEKLGRLVKKVILRSIEKERR